MNNLPEWTEYTGLMSLVVFCEKWIHNIFSVTYFVLTSSPPSSSYLLCSFEIIAWKRKLQCAWESLCEKWDQSIRGETGKQAHKKIFFNMIISRQNLRLHLTQIFRLLTSSRQPRGGRVQKAGRTRHQGSLWAARVELPPLPLALDSLKIGRTETHVAAIWTTSCNSLIFFKHNLR